MRTQLALIALLCLFFVQSASAQKTGKVEVYLNGKALRVANAVVYDDRGSRYIRFDIDPTDSLAQNTFKTMPGAVFVLEIETESKPTVYSTMFFNDYPVYNEQTERPISRRPDYMRLDGQFFFCYGAFEQCGVESSLKLTTIVNTPNRFQGRFHFEARENKLLYTPDYTLEGSFDLPTTKLARR